MEKSDQPTPAFKCGDVVMLKSGGPRLTVVACNDKEVVTEYFLENGEYRSYWAHPDCFDKISFPNRT